MALTSAQRATLATELTNDPKTLGYSTKTNQQCADALNTAGLVATDPKINAGVVSTQKLINNVVESELESLSTVKLTAFQIYMSVGSLDTGNANVRAGLGAIFGVGTTTRANFLAAVDRAATRAETLFGSGTIVDQSDVSAARGTST